MCRIACPKPASAGSRNEKTYWYIESLAVASRIQRHGPRISESSKNSGDALHAVKTTSFGALCPQCEGKAEFSRGPSPFLPLCALQAARKWASSWPKPLPASHRKHPGQNAPNSRRWLADSILGGFSKRRKRIPCDVGLAVKLMELAGKLNVPKWHQMVNGAKD